MDADLEGQIAVKVCGLRAEGVQERVCSCGEGGEGSKGCGEGGEGGEQAIVGVVKPPGGCSGKIGQGVQCGS